MLHDVYNASNHRLTDPLGEESPGRQYPDSKIHLANMSPIWVLSAPDGPHVGPMNLAIRVISLPKGH